MTGKLKARGLFLTLLAAALLMLSSGFAAETVRLVDNLEDYEARLSLSTTAGNAVNLNLEIDAVGLKPAESWGNNYKTAGLPGGDKLMPGSTGEIGEPEIPSLTTLIAIPDQAGVTVTAHYESYEIIDDIDLLPVQTPMPEGGFDGPATFAKDINAYSQNEFYPEILAEAGEPMIMRDVRIVQIAVYPVQYNPVTRQMKVYRDLSIDISYEGEVVNPKTTRANYISEAFLPLYRSMIANFDEYMTTLTTTEVKRGGILIVTPNLSGYLWKNAMAEIANWKRKKGYDVALVTTNDVTANGRPTQTQMKTYLQTAYNTWEVPPEFVYLVGDEDINIIPDYPYSYYVSDHQYACLDGTDWIPDVAVSRVSVDNLNELNTWIAKTLKYERDPDISIDPGYWKRAIMVAGAQQTVTCPWIVLWARERLLMHGFTHIDTVFDRGSDPPDNLITNPITAGVGYINYRGWAGASGWYDPSYNVSSLNQCQNINKPGVMTSIVCGTGDFGDGSYDPCFGETWIRMGSATAPRGGPSFFGCTDHGTHTKWNNPISFGLYNAFLEEGAYHFGIAVIAGKMTQYMNYPRDLSTIQKYFHTYNALGDPELEMRLTTPISLTVNHLTEVGEGESHLEVRVMDEFDNYVENAYVTLVRGAGESESFFSVAKTDAYGMAHLDMPTDSLGTLDLTVTGRDLNPYMATVNMVQADMSVGYTTFTIDDDMNGASKGNGDGQINPGETIELGVELKNFGSTTTAENAYADLFELYDGQLAIHNNYVTYGNIAPGQVASGYGKFIFTVLPNVTNSDELILRLEPSADNYDNFWLSLIHLPVVAPSFEISNIQISDNNRLDPGETVDMTITLENIGGLDAEGLTGTLKTTDGYIQIGSAAAGFGDIDVDGTGNNSATPFSVTVHEATFEGKSIPFILDLTSADGVMYQVTFNLVVGAITASDPGGPDAYGYYVYDDTDIGYSEHPSYNWMEIRTLGTNRYLTDDSKTMVDLPFNFVYYGDTYDRITICSNGWICMDSTYWVAFRNWRMPDPSYAKTMIAGFWDDLGPSGTNNVFTYYDTDNNRYIIEWYHVVARWNTSYQETFQIILYDQARVPTVTGDGIIEFVYQDVNNYDNTSGENYATVGWEDSTESIGFSISYSNVMAPGCANLADNRVYRITPNTGRGAISGGVRYNGEGLSDVIIETSTGQWTVSDAEGVFTVVDVPPGTVELYLHKDGYFPQIISDINVTANVNIGIQFANMDICPIPDGLQASQGLNDHVHLDWADLSHPDLAGYNIYRADWVNGIFEMLNDVPVFGSSYDDFTTEGSNIYWYYVTAVFTGSDYGIVSMASTKAMGSNDEITDVEETANIPEKFSLSQNYPNPFNARTVIDFAVPTAGPVTLDIFNILGQKVATLYNGNHEAGYMSVVWNATDDAGNDVASGLYFYRVMAGSEQITKRMLMLK